jgi:kynureninase
VSLTHAESLDRDDPLVFARDRFHLPDDVIYLDGNSLGPLPRGVAERVADVASREWGNDLIASWNANGWMDLPARVGDRIGGLIGAGAGQVMVADSTSINLYKLLHAALGLRSDRTVILTEHGNFPSDSYLIDSVAAERGVSVRRVSIDNARPATQVWAEALAPGDVAVLCVTHVNYRTGAKHDMAAITAQSHAAGALVLWDLAHSAGAMDLHLDDLQVDLAVGCGYKFLNGGPGAPAFAYVNRRHHDNIDQPLTGWLGHADPFAMADTYRPAPGVGRLRTGTPPVLSLAALDAALDAFDGVDLAVLRSVAAEKAQFFATSVETLCEGDGFELLTPKADDAGSQVSFRHHEAYAIVRALVAARVIGDYREPGIARFGITPLYTTYADLWNAATRLRAIMASDGWKSPEFSIRQAVT